VEDKADRGFIWHFYDERSNDMAAVEDVRRTFGFCADTTRCRSASAEAD
jgi:hypothetical protein